MITSVQAPVPQEGRGTERENRTVLEQVRKHANLVGLSRARISTTGDTLIHTVWESGLIGENSAFDARLTARAVDSAFSATTGRWVTDITVVRGSGAPVIARTSALINQPTGAAYVDFVLSADNTLQAVAYDDGMALNFSVWIETWA